MAISQREWFEQCKSTKLQKNVKFKVTISFLKPITENIQFELNHSRFILIAFSDKKYHTRKTINQNK